jgi:transaldolase
VLADVAELGVDYDDVMRVLETDGIEKFDASWDALGHELLPMLRAPRA